MERKSPLYILVLAYVVGCSGEVASTADTAPGVWTIDDAPVLAIGADESDRGHLLDGVVAARLLPDGGLVVADRGSHEIRLFEADGSLRRRWGRGGEGPGDFLSIAEMHLLPPDTLLVYDSKLHRITTFDAHGALLGDVISLTADDGWVEIYMGRTSGGAHIGAWIRQFGRDRSRITPDIMGLRRYGPTAGEVSDLGDEMGMRRTTSPSPLSTHFLGAVLGDSVYHTDGLTGEVRITDANGNRAGSFRLYWDPPPFDQAWEAVESAADSLNLGFIRQLKGATGLDSVPILSHILATDDGHLWIKRYDPSTDSHYLGRRRSGGEWAVVKRNGTQVSTVQVPEGFHPLDIRGDRVVGLRRTAFDVEIVEVRRLNRR